MTEQKDATKPAKLWISYAWVNNEEKDFAYLASHLATRNIETAYDSIRLAPDDHLSKRIIQRLQSIGFDGWICILTPQCITRREYTNELTSAIDQTKLHMGARFPIAGLMYGIAGHHLPPILRLLPCVSLGDPDWNERIRCLFSTFRATPCQSSAQNETRFIWKVHPVRSGDGDLTLIEVRTRGEFIPEWRFAVPKTCRLIRWGQGNSGGREISRVRFEEAYGSGRYGKSEVLWFGAANTISNSESAYVLFSGKLPDFICFGPAQNKSGIPGRMEIFWPGRRRESICA